MSSKSLLIVRHGETDYNRKGILQGRRIDAPLNATGKKQALKLGNYISRYRTSSVFCSSLIRTHQTAKPFCEQWEESHFATSELDEMDFGDFEGTPYNEAKIELKEIQTAWQSGETSLKIPGGESPEDVYQRANQSVRKLMKTISEDILIFVVHGRLIRILLSEWLGHGLKNMDKIEHQNAAVNHIVFDGFEFKPKYLNKISHLSS